MSHGHRPYRSVLYIPGSRESALRKASRLPVDAIILDLEDAVTPDRKACARRMVADILNSTTYGKRTKIVRINGLDTEWGADDVIAMKDTDADALLLPKTGSASDLDALADLAHDIDFWAMIETPAGILHAEGIAAHSRLKGFVLGTNDLAKDLNCRFRPDRMPLLTSLQFALLAARAHGAVCVDGVYNAFKDAEGLRAECVQGRDMGFDGKTLIHPSQIATANEVFAPTADETGLARRRIVAFEAAEAAGQGVAVVDGKIVENLHVTADRALLAKAEAMAELEKAI